MFLAFTGRYRSLTLSPAVWITIPAAGRNYHRGVAQLAERWSPKPEVESSIPSAPAIYAIRRETQRSGAARRKS